MSDDRMNELVGFVRETYHVPPKTPREEMWRVISEGIRGERARSDGAGDAGPDGVVDLGAERARRTAPRGLFLWATAAAALVVLGIGIGRVTAPAPAGEVASVVAPPSARAALALAAQEHFGRTESLLTMVRADARRGNLDPATAEWARDLLVETRLLLDAGQGGNPTVAELLEDLELVLVQIVGAAGVPSVDPRGRTELDLALRGLEDGEVLSRIQAALPEDMAGA